MGWSPAGKRGRRQAMAVALMGAALLAGCRGNPEVTGLRITARWSGVAVDQLQFTVRNHEGELLIDKQRRPSKPGPLKSGADVVLYFADSLGKTDVTCELEGLSMDRVVATAHFTARLVS